MCKGEIRLFETDLNTFAISMKPSDNRVASSLNHSITPDIKLNRSEGKLENGKHIRWFMTAGKRHLFLAKFSSINKANQFKAALEKCIIG